MSKGVSLKDFTKAFAYTTTKSGPVEPARTTPVKMMKGTLGPVGDQTSQKWDHRTYDNKSLLAKKNYLSLKDIGIKIMAEATSSTSYNPMRLNLSGMDQTKTSMHGEFVQDGNNITFNLRYPNVNDDISVELALDDGQSVMYNVPLDSDEFKGNFAQALRLKGRELIHRRDSKMRENMADSYGTVAMPQNNFNDSLALANSDTNNITAYESVDWRLNKLLDLCNEAEAMFEADDFTASDFSAGSDEGGNDQVGNDLGGNDNMGGPQNAGQVNGVTDGNGKGKNNPEFRDFVNPDGTNPDYPGLSQSAWDNMAQIVADALNYTTTNQSDGVKPSASEWYDGFPGVKGETPSEILEQFLSFEDYKALDTTLPLEGLQQFAHALEGGKVDITKFKTDLGKWFPDVYNTDGTAIHDVAKETAAMTFPQDNNGEFGGGDFGMDSNVNLGGISETGDMMDDAQTMVGNGNTDAGIDMTEDGSNSEEPGNDKTDLALDSLDNIF